MKTPACTRLALFLVLALVAPLAAKDPAPASSQAIHSALQPFIDSQQLAGVVTLVADKDKILALDALGYADVATKKPMSTDAMFWIASQSKPITATAFMTLVDEGKVSLDDPVEKYLPEFKGEWLAVESDKDHVLLKHPRHPITVRNVLSHTSGLPFKSAIEEPTLDRMLLMDRVRSYAMTPLVFEPDSKYQYSNAGINTAGRIIEVVTGQKYEDYLQTRLFDPLGMKDTTFWPNKSQIARLAKSHKPNEAKDGLEETPIAQLHYPLDAPERQPMPAGGLFSTASDMSRFGRMLLNRGTFEGKRILSEQAVAEMTRRQTADDLKESYGLGFKVGPGSAFGHGGAYGTNTTVDPDTGLVTIYVIQHAGFLKDGKAGLSVFKKAADEAFGKR
jgi:CubicO group peptidase (beta-lactamase class C family)